MKRLVRELVELGLTIGLVVLVVILGHRSFGGLHFWGWVLCVCGAVLLWIVIGLARGRFRDRKPPSAES